ncbi:MAG: FGGY family carbohydrate kinase [Anaerotignum sp.]|nr:FGGY family carbohydrate kinase [Anaerotignum sp.]
MKILALESSTTSAKAMVFDTDTGKFHVESVPYILKYTDVTMHDAKEVFEQTVYLGKKMCEGQKIDMVSLSGTWHSLMLCNQEMEPQTPIYLWSYTGAADICKELRKDEAYVNRFYQKTGCMVNAIYPVFKIKLLRQLGYKLENYRFVGQGTYNTYRLTGQWAVTDSVASGTGLLNIHTKAFDEDILKENEIRLDQLPQIITYQDTLKLNEEGAELLGLPQGTPVIATNPDGGLNQVGAGAVEEGIMSFSVGTSGALRFSTSAPILPHKPSTWCYLSPKSWLSGAATSGCCNCIDWFKGKYFQEDISYSQMEGGCKNIEDVPVFLPFLFGERCPGWNDERDGGFYGLKPSHTVYDSYRAIQEGILFNLYQCYEELIALNGKPKKVMLSGGIIRSKVWTQMCADIFQIEMTIDEVEHSSLIGSVALGMELLGILHDAKDFKSNYSQVITPNPERKDFYQKKYQKYLYWYEVTKEQGN